jgi:methyl-accepting chemotaxis protein
MTVMLDSMGKIRAASEGTAVIIKDINDIAFQTNLLALNAAVEAARAGDAGRGFAVVAEEVRNLAGRAKEAAKKTEELIKESVKLADGGQVVSTEVNGHLSEITSSVGKVTSIVAEIAEASKEQSRGIGQVNKALTEMDKVTQQNAANSEESSSAAEELASQAQELAEMIGRFSLSRATVQRVAKRKQLGPATHATATKTAGKPVTSKSAGAKSRAAKQEEFIPMEDDPEFANF